jgi:hypothetical protein
MKELDRQSLYEQICTHRETNKGGQKWNAILEDILALYISYIPKGNQEIDEERLWSFLFDTHTQFESHETLYEDVYLFLFSPVCDTFLDILYIAVTDPPKEWWCTHILK